jgi:predicted nuclease of predicted toxin-antitoxin system
VSRVYFTDRDLGKQCPRILAEAGIVVERHGDLFQPAGSDEEWLEHCGTNGRIAVSHNSRIRYVPNELDAVKRFKVPLLILVGQVTTAELAHNFVRTLPRIEAFLDGRSPPFIGKVYLYRAMSAELAKSAATPGRVELWFPKT